MELMPAGIVISAFEVTTDTNGFARCTWPAVSRGQAMRLALQLSAKYAADPRYPNAFWVQTTRPPITKSRPGLYGDVKFLAKFYKGHRYEPAQTI